LKILAPQPFHHAYLASDAFAMSKHTFYIPEIKWWKWYDVEVGLELCPNIVWLNDPSEVDPQDYDVLYIQKEYWNEMRIKIYNMPKIIRSSWTFMPPGEYLKINGSFRKYPVIFPHSWFLKSPISGDVIYPSINKNIFKGWNGKKDNQIIAICRFGNRENYCATSSLKEIAKGFDLFYATEQTPKSFIDLVKAYRESLAFIECAPGRIMSAAALQAIMTGTPTLWYDYYKTSLLTNGKDGFSINSVEEGQKILKKLKTDIDFRKEISSNSRKTGLKLFDPDTLAYSWNLKLQEAIDLHNKEERISISNPVTCPKCMSSKIRGWGPFEYQCEKCWHTWNVNL